jgi:hypothetical protein
MVVLIEEVHGVPVFPIYGRGTTHALLPNTFLIAYHQITPFIITLLS